MRLDVVLRKRIFHRKRTSIAMVGVASWLRAEARICLARGGMDILMVVLPGNLQETIKFRT